MNQNFQYDLVIPGAIGEESVLKALLGPNIKVSRLTLEGYKVCKQPKPPDHIWTTLREAWDDKGITFQGAYTLVQEEGGQADVGCVEFKSLKEMELTCKILEDWNFHEPDQEKGWFRSEVVRDGKGNAYVTEVLNCDPDNLVEVNPNYRENPTYQEFVRAMTEQVIGYRANLEGSSIGKEF